MSEQGREAASLHFKEEEEVGTRRMWVTSLQREGYFTSRSEEHGESPSQLTVRVTLTMLTA